MDIDDIKGVKDLKGLDNITVLDFGLSAVDRLHYRSNTPSERKRYEHLSEICYLELCRRRREEKDKLKRMLYDASYGDLMDTMRKAERRGDEMMIKACYNEILWRQRLREIGYKVEQKTALQKLDEIIIR